MKTKKNGIYMMCVLAFIVILAVVSFIIDRKIKENEEKMPENAETSEDVMLTVYGEMSKEELMEHIKASVVRIEADAASENGISMVGSGVVLEVTDEYIDIATAGHVVEQTAGPLVYFYDGSLAYGSVLAYGKESDIAFIRVEATSFADGVGADITAVRSGDNDYYDKLVIGKEVIMLGSLSEVADTTINSTVKEKDRFVELFQNHMLICEGTVSGGMSGGGTYCPDGKLIGIIVGVGDTETACVAITDVMAEYRSISY